jgi:hypothetical protein
VIDTIFVFAQEHGGGEKSLWDPTIIGVLVVIAAVVLFCGSIYLILATDVGARLGFLVSFTGLMGFMVLLSALWITTASPLNTIKGRVPEWEAKQIVTNLDEADIPEARTIVEEGEEASATEAANVKAEVDETLVAVTEPGAEEEAAEPSEFAIFQEVTEYLTLTTYEIGGSEPNPFDFEVTHEPLIAVVEFCEVVDVEVPFGLAPPEPECDPASENSGFLILERDLGSLRVPPFVALGMSSVLFGVGLLALHWREKDERSAAAAATRPAPVPTKA